uniref:Olfactory receptor n=1 Tax=Pseudonaja textilis TaxID=8673 RepID=A0A670YWG4_PSETE
FCTGMSMTQNSTVTEFILLGLSSDPQAQFILFGVFFIIYLMAVVGNIIILLIVSLDVRLHNPMYFFLCNLSVIDIGYTTSTVPKMLMNYLSNDKRISFSGCLSQMYFFISFGGIECLLLGIMAYDRYAAICHPLHYGVLMRQPLCQCLVACSWAIGNLNAITNTTFVFSLHFCSSNKIMHFFCDIPPLLHLSCSDISLVEMVTFIISGSIMITTVSFIVLSYFFIISAVQKIHTIQGKIKTFSTCASHLTVVSLFYSTAIFTYMRPSSSRSIEQDCLISLMYTVVTPLLNPLIYSFKNKEMQSKL